MRATKLAGPEAASQKYDILTALGCHALTGPAGVQRLVLRFLTLVTARYNWRMGQLHVGQREIARLWSVDERTVKREMARLRTLGWITLESPARRGRVASYALDLGAIRAATRAAWPRVGEDFEARMGGGGVRVRRNRRPVPAPGHRGGIVPCRPGGRGRRGVGRCLEPDAPDASGRRCGRLRQLVRRAAQPGQGRGPLVLVAPSAFHASYVRTHYAERLAAAARRTCGAGEIRIVTGTDPAG